MGSEVNGNVLNGRYLMIWSWSNVKYVLGTKTWEIVSQEGIFEDCNQWYLRRKESGITWEDFW